MSLRSNAKIVLTKSARLHVVIASVFLNAHLFSSDWDCPMSYNHPRLTSLLLLSPLQLMGERCWVFFVFFLALTFFSSVHEKMRGQLRQETHGRCCMKTALYHRTFKGRRRLSPGGGVCVHARTYVPAHGPASLEEHWRGERQPQCGTSVNKCAPGVKVQPTSIFSPASYSLQETFEAMVGWYGFALGAAKFVCT